MAVSRAAAADSPTPTPHTHGQCFVHTNQMLGQRVLVAGNTPTGPPWFEEQGYHYRWATPGARGAAAVEATAHEPSATRGRPPRPSAIEAEVLTALLLAHVQDHVVAQLPGDGASFNATNVAIAVPPYWGSERRTSLLDAAALAGLGVRTRPR
eukprot:COSAG01_NODE_8255_length_2855_cov_5.639695_4_plen_153_part_00